MDDYIPLAFASYMNGINFLASAQKLASELELDALGRPKNLTAIPMYFLASHAAELFLKAALLKRGFEEKKLKQQRYRHDLHALIYELLQYSVRISQQTIQIVHGLSAQHQNHQLRYTVLLDNGEKTYWPPISILFEALNELLLLTRISKLAMPV